MRVIIAGSRGFSDYDSLCSYCDSVLIGLENVEIVSGTAIGADKMGEKYAEERGFTIKKFPADWEQYGKSAGYLRNKEMAEYADCLILFWDGVSKGSKHMLDLANKGGLVVYVCTY